ncbi:polysaccharide pyruvyl transferase family protein [Paraburkholderia caribensis]|uniref:Chromosome condensation regulator RCC1 n=1 Tax=Paraburkholderia caribensis TaxID=75105 RepID=A0A9Q6WNI2_9BURK|nr:polysaccharide pyruvyl transferase family protein [Paraburkholderia caribensis]MCO4880860.1 polysaccharide pyruvyl transferase family protein [Paraburkholderia caribensis]PTB25136.1 chromosome condensation regulator RCC1 [Paraburkholderia caribensis]QLB64516.1 chromosome condensation regulator RCC1 [Paraburkholderia caribensis]
MSAQSLPVVLFGAFDRHNFGDMLFPHVVARMLAGRDVRFAGLVPRDLRPHGGHRVQALRQWHERAVDLLHVGGEILTCDACDAAVMLQPDHDAQRIIASQQHDRSAWAQHVLDTRELAPYVVSKDAWPRAGRVLFNAIGGVTLDDCDLTMRDEVLAKLARADDVSVRDIHTQALLAKSGIEARLAPDCAVMVAELFGDAIRAHAATQAVARIREAAPRGYLAVQFSADFGDDATLDRIAAQLDHAAHAHDLAIVFFRAGAAPWHDDLSCFARTAARMRARSVHLFDSLNIWDICALLAHSRGYIGSSLHGRIVAIAHALPRINLLHDEDFVRPCKQTAFAQTWEDADQPVAARVNGIAEGIDSALSVDPARLKHTAARLVALCREGFQTTVSVLTR